MKCLVGAREGEREERTVCLKAGRGVKSLCVFRDLFFGVQIMSLVRRMEDRVRNKTGKIGPKS